MYIQQEWPLSVKFFSKYCFYSMIFLILSESIYTPDVIGLTQSQPSINIPVIGNQNITPKIPRKSCENSCHSSDY